jgi:hypothetical protein
LQRERGLTERLHKQLEDQEKQQKELKLILSTQQQDATTILTEHEDIIKDVLSAGADRGTRYASLATLEALTNFEGWTNV